MANKDNNEKNVSVKKNTVKVEKKASKNNKVAKKTNTKTKSSSAKKTNTTKSNSKTKKINKDLEKTIIIEDIENKINEIVENKNVAKLENAKYIKNKKNKQLLAIGVVISLLGIIALIITLIANRIVDKNFISDNAIILMVIASILIEIFGAFIIINEA